MPGPLPQLRCPRICPDYGRDKLSLSERTDFRRLLRASCVSLARPAPCHRRMFSNQSGVLFEQTAAYEHRLNTWEQTANKKALIALTVGRQAFPLRRQASAV